MGGLARYSCAALLILSASSTPCDDLRAALTPAALDARGACLVAPARPPRGSSARVVVVTGVNARHENEFDVDLALSKLAYASAHASLRFAFYCADDFAEALAAHNVSRRWEYVKILMLRDALRAHADQDWAAWLDADAWINPREAHVPLGAWLAGVPARKTIALGNVRALNTGAFAVRTGARGAALVERWLAIARAGDVECHPHDQAALQLLLLRRLHASVVGSAAVAEPFGYRCRRPRCGARPGGTFFSCNPLFEPALARAHAAARAERGGAAEPARCFRTARGRTCTSPGLFARAGREERPYFPPGELFARGLGNDEVPEFHIVSEARDRPRLQCFRCQRVDGIDRMPGLNYRTRELDSNATDAWLVNHKSLALFYKVAFRTEWRNPEHSCYYSGRFQMKER